MKKEDVCDYEWLSLNLLVKFRDAIAPFLNQDLDVEVRRDDRLFSVSTSQENVSRIGKNARVMEPRAGFEPATYGSLYTVYKAVALTTELPGLIQL